MTLEERGARLVDAYASTLATCPAGRVGTQVRAWHPRTRGIPAVLEARDTRGLIAPLSAARREWLDDWVCREGHFIRRNIEKEVLACGLRIDEVVVVVRSTALGNWRAWPQGDFSIREHEPFLEAARFAAIPDHVMFLFEPAEGDGYAVAWVAPERRSSRRQ